MLDALLSQNEGKTLEFKENAHSLNKIVQTLVAFSNTAGGTLIIGVRDKTKEVVGVNDILMLEEQISNVVAESVMPLLVPNFQFFTWRGREVLIITITYQPGPYYIKSKGLDAGVYVRLGSTNRIADNATISEIKRLVQHESFDELPVIKASKDDIDFDLAKNLFSKVSKKFDQKKAISLNLLVDHHSKYFPSNASIILFGKNRQQFFPDAIIRCGRFRGTSKLILDDQLDIDKPLPLAIKEVLSFIDRNTSTRSEIKGMQRTDIQQYPPVVVREAVINAIVHADYTVKGSNIQVAIFSDRIEISNPGALPFGLSLERALGGFSQLRNRVIGKVFRELGLTEHWGSGLNRMIETCREMGLTEPKFEEQDHFFRVTLYHDAKSSIVTEPWKKLIVDYLLTNKEINTTKAADLWQVTNRTASSRLRKMCDSGLISEISTGPYDPQKKYVLVQSVDISV